MVIGVITTDQKIWNLAKVVQDLCYAMSQHKAIEINMMHEGPDICTLGLEQIVLDCAGQFGYDLSMLKITDNDNLIIDTVINHESWAPMQFVRNIQGQMAQLPTRPKQITKHFGMFIGRSNAPRLNLSAYLYTRYCNQSTQTFHYTPKLDFHRENLGLDELACNQIEQVDLQSIGKFLQAAPLTLDTVTYPILMDQHLRISDQYSDFFVEICCETYFSGKTFFPTEKTWRAIANRTPFVIQGPQHYLDNLKALGFKTFDRWWDEGYSKDLTEWQVCEIKTIIDSIADRSVGELNQMLVEMEPVLQHNYQRLQQLTMFDFEDCYEL